MIELLARYFVSFCKPNKQGVSPITLALKNKNDEMLCIMLMSVKSTYDIAATDYQNILKRLSQIAETYEQMIQNLRDKKIVTEAEALLTQQNALNTLLGKSRSSKAEKVEKPKFQCVIL